MAGNWIQKATAKMKRKGTLGKFGKATEKKIAAGKKAGGVRKKEAIFAQNVKSAAKHKDHAGRGGKREAKGHDAIGDHAGYSMMMKKK
jgi:hypothetical protein